MRLKEIAEYLNLSIDNNLDFEINGINELTKAKQSEISFIVDKKHINELKNSQAGVVITTKELSGYVKSIPLISDEVYLSFAKLTKLFAKPLFSAKEQPIIDKSSIVDKTAKIGNGSIIGKNSVIMANVSIGENVKIGDNTIIYPNVVIYNDTIIGNDCIINGGVIIGSDGFGFAHTKNGEHIKIYHNGNVIIEDDVDIGANTTIDRAVFGSTIVKKGSKIDNLVQIAHNCEIGEYSIIVAQTGLSGSTILGRNVVMGGQSATAGHLKIGAFTTLAARSGVTKSIAGNKTYSGFPLMEHKKWLKLQAKLSNLLKGDKK